MNRGELIADGVRAKAEWFANNEEHIKGVVGEGFDSVEQLPFIQLMPHHYFAIILPHPLIKWKDPQIGVGGSLHYSINWFGIILKCVVLNETKTE